MYNDATMGTNVAELKKPEPKRQTEISKALECLETEKEMLKKIKNKIGMWLWAGNPFSKNFPN